MILNEVPVDEMSNVLTTCYVVGGKTLSYAYAKTIHDSYEEALKRYEELKKTVLNGEETVHVFLGVHEAGYWLLEPMIVKEFDHGEETVM